MKFIDEVKIKVISGKGGPGAVSFRREALVPRGGPDGGDGGKGGDVIFEVDSRLHSLLDLRFQKIYKAQDGEPGQKANRSGSNGADLILKVPSGTVVKTPSGAVLNDLAETPRIVFLKGGLGGKGNTFYKSSVHQAPMIAQKGLPGQECEIQLELKLLADVGFVGLPNAGKSTLISRISSARPKIADYPFTTLVPNLGVVRFRDELSFVVADIPGLIEGASQGAGLGIQFLRHIERTKTFVHLIDVSEMAGKDPLAAYDEIRKELESYDRQKAESDGFVPLAERPELVALNKIDTIDTMALKQIEGRFRERGVEVISLSAATGENIQELVLNLGNRLFSKEKA